MDMDLMDHIVTPTSTQWSKVELMLPRSYLYHAKNGHLKCGWIDRVLN